MSPDPLIFDLNGDGTVEVTGGPVAKKPVSIPSGAWDIEIVRQHNNARYIINDANTNNGLQTAGNSTNASGSWKIGVESEDDGSWKPQDAEISVDEKNRLLASRVKI